MAEKVILSCVLQGKKGLLLERPGKDKVYLVATRSSDKVEAGEVVKGELLREEENYALFRVTSLRGRMVLEVSSTGWADLGVILCQGPEKFSLGRVTMDELEPHIELKTWFARWTKSPMGASVHTGDTAYILILQGHEKKIEEIFMPQRYTIVVDSLTSALLTQYSSYSYVREEMRVGELKTLEEFVQAWEDRLFFRRFAKANRAKISESEARILLPHLAAWSFFSEKWRKRSLQEGWGSLKGREKIPPHLQKYGNEHGVYRHAIAFPLQREAMEHFRSLDEITRENVVRFLADRKSIFPVI